MQKFQERSMDERIIDALEKSGFGERLATLKDGLNTPLSTEFDENGINLSGGESQKVAIARAFYKNSSLIILDEPSSALDPIAEYNLNKAMQKIAKKNRSFIYRIVFPRPGMQIASICWKQVQSSSRAPTGSCWS